MKKKQVLAAVLAAVMGASMLAGCGNSAESGNVSSGNESSQAASSSETEQQGQTGQEPAELEPVEREGNIADPLQSSGPVDLCRFIILLIDPKQTGIIDDRIIPDIFPQI